MKRYLFIICATLMLSNCVWYNKTFGEPEEAKPVVSNEQVQEEAQATENQDTPAKAEEKVDMEVGVNPYLWHATVSRLGFMPLETNDANEGVLITEWTAMDKTSNEYFKISVKVLSKTLRADALNVQVFKRSFKDGKWSSELASQVMATEIDKSIIEEARRLYRIDMIKNR